MATIHELFASREGDGYQQTRIYCVMGEGDADAARALVASTAPLNSGAANIPRDPRSIAVERITPTEWIGTVTYRFTTRTAPPVPADAARISFSTRGQSIMMLQGLAEVARFPATAPDFAGAINVTEEGPQGVEIIAPTLSFQIRKARATVDASYLQILRSRSASVNNATFQGFPAGEVLYLGVDGEQRSDGIWDLTHSFAVEENISGQTFGSITGVSKKGWEYLWFSYSRELDSTATPPRMRDIATSAHVVRVYRETDFSSLGLT